MTPTTDRLEPSAGETLELPPARWQGWAMTLMPLLICYAFAAALWFGVDEGWGRPLAPVFAVFGVWAAVTGNKQMRRLRVRADAAGVFLDDGTRRGRTDQRALWEDVASCTVRRDDGTWFVLRGRDGRDLLVFQDRLLSRRDTARLLRFVKVELESRNARFDVPDRWS